MDIEVVYEKNDDYDVHVGPHGSIKVGLKIENRIVWLAISHSYGTKGQAEEYTKWENIAKEIVSKCK